MNGFRILMAGIELEGEGKPEPSDNSLETGVIFLGGASDTVGVNRCGDSSDGTYYGDGRRYAHTETPFITKVRSHSRQNGDV